MLVNKGTKMHYLFFHLSVQPWSSVNLSVRLSGEKQNKRDFAPWRSNTHFCLNWSHNANETFLPFASENNPPPTTAFVHSGSSLCRNLLQSHADSCFVYQNIFVLSVHLHQCSACLVRFPRVLPFARASLTGRRFLVINLPPKRSLVARGTAERQGSILGILVPNWQCWPLCREGEQTIIWVVLFKIEISKFPADGLMQHQLCSSVRNVFFSSFFCTYMSPVIWRLISPNT